jgi:hypothetical protein
MEFRCDHNVISEIRVRPNGYTTMQDHGGCSAGEVAAYQEIYFWTFTDENGIIEWMTEPYGNPWNGYVCGYIREA